MLEKLHIFVSLIAGIIYTIYALLNNFEFFSWMQNVIWVLILFFILGLITRHFLKKSFTPEPIEQVDVTVEETDADTDDIDTDEEEISEFDSEDDDRKPRRRFDFSRDDDDDDEEEEN